MCQMGQCWVNEKVGGQVTWREGQPASSAMGCVSRRGQQKPHGGEAHT